MPRMIACSTAAGLHKTLTADIRVSLSPVPSALTESLSRYYVGCQSEHSLSSSRQRAPIQTEADVDYIEGIPGGTLL